MKYANVTSLGDLGVIQIIEGPEPSCAADEVCIKVAFSGVGAIDAIMRRGDLGDANPKPPFTPGLEASGRIVAVGNEVKDLSVGDKVAALLLLRMGGYAEVVTCKASSVVKLPPGLALADAASLVNPTTAVVAATMVQPRPAETVVIHGAAGGLAGAIGQVIKALYPKTTIIGTVRNKKQSNHHLGFDRVMTTDEFTAACGAGVQYDVILDPVGGDLRRISLSSLVPRGRMLVLGNVSGDTSSDISSQEIWLKGRWVGGLNVGYLNSIEPQTVKKAAQRAVDLAVTGRIKLTPAKKFTFTNVVGAHKYLESVNHQGRVVLEMA